MGVREYQEGSGVGVSDGVAGEGAAGWGVVGRSEVVVSSSGSWTRFDGWA